MNLVQPRILSGFTELLPEDQIVFNQMLEIIRTTYESFGFLPLDTPVIELSEILLAKAGGETEKQIYRFQKGDNDLSLRFDQTVPLARYTAQHAADLTFPFKRYQMGKVFRGERPQKGRFREFYQCDIDVIGQEQLSLYYDAEMPAVIHQIFEAFDRMFGVGGHEIRINNRKVLGGFFESLHLKEKMGDILRAIDKLEKIGGEKVREELAAAGVSAEDMDRIFEFLLLSGSNEEKLQKLAALSVESDLYKEGVQDLLTVIGAMRALGVPEDCFTLDLTIARGLDYYTGTVYETRLREHPEFGSVCGGGRYDDLASHYTREKLPGNGISIGLTRLFMQLKEAGIVTAKRRTLLQVLVLPMGEEQMTAALSAARRFREKGLIADVYYEPKGMKQKMKYAARIQVPFVCLIGEEEEKQGKVMLRDMESGIQELAEIEESIRIIEEKKI